MLSFLFYQIYYFLQVSWLNNQLVLENRIKEGAENLLNMSLTVCVSRCICDAVVNVTKGGSANYGAIRIGCREEQDPSYDKTR